MQLLNQEIEGYLEQLASREDDPVLLEMEELATRTDFPIVGRLCGRLLELVSRAAKARRIFELGSGFGYSGYWFARALTQGGELHLTDRNPDNRAKAEDFLSRAGAWDKVVFYLGDALEALQETPGDFDIIYCDMDKRGYPQAWEEARGRLRPGGLFIADNTLWRGRVVAPEDDPNPDMTAAIAEMNRAIASEPGFVSSLIPLRDGLHLAVKTA